MSGSAWFASTAFACGLGDEDGRAGTGQQTGNHESQCAIRGP